MIRLFNCRYAQPCWKCRNYIPQGARAAYVGPRRLYCETCARPVMVAEARAKEQRRDATAHAAKMKESD